MSEGERKFNSLEQVRSEIDRIDAQILALLGERAAMVKHVMTFKPNVQAVRHYEREQFVIRRAQELAKQYHLDEEFAADLFRIIIDYFSGRQEKEIAARTGGWTQLD
jgi:isochorismate pyruvate lyase